MSAIEASAPAAPIYHSDLGLFPFQVDGIAQMLVLGKEICTWDWGCGKSHLILAGASMMFEDDNLDLVVLMCEVNKLDEWDADFEKFTTLTHQVYRGDVKRRAKIRANLPQVMICTYETARNDLLKVQKVKKGRRTVKEVTHQPLLELLVERAREGKKTMVVFDESTRLGNRQSGVYLAQERLAREIRKVDPSLYLPVMLTASKFGKDPENFFNQWRIADPEGAGTVADFERDYVIWRDPMSGKATFKNIGVNDMIREPEVATLWERVRPIVSQKKKTDPDVMAAFPKAVEEPVYVDLSKLHREFYDAVEAMLPEEPDLRDQQKMFGLLRLIANHPRSLLHSKAAKTEGTLAHQILHAIGPDTLMEMECAKEKEMIRRLDSMVNGQGAQALVFTFFGQAVAPLLFDALRGHGFDVGLYGCGQSQAYSEDAKARFKAGQHRVLLLSDAGARGLNLPEAMYTHNYEMGLTHEINMQRVNRSNRIDSGHPSTLSLNYISKDTVEEAIVTINMKRHAWSDLLSDLPEGEQESLIGKLPADERARLFARARRRSQ